MNQLHLSDFNYNLPPELIAQHPVRPRDHSRLMVLLPQADLISHKHFYDIKDYLHPGDILILNDSKVIPARLLGQKPTGGKVEIFLLRELQLNEWECLIGANHIAPGNIVALSAGFQATVLVPLTDNTWRVKFNKENITSIGDVPLPPYISERNDMVDYQTVYAKAEGSVAAPTAGLHFTQELLQQLRQMGIVIKTVTLHVGLGTFLPVKTDDLSQHIMHKEYAELSNDTAKAINEAKENNKQIIAVGTTAARTLEAFHGKANSDWVDLFITPGYNFNTITSMITNFHLPQSTLLMLVSALAGKTMIDRAYRLAIDEKYRFYSFGDAMFISTTV